VIPDPAPRLTETSFGEIPPTAGLLPRWCDLLAVSGGKSFEQSLCEQIGLDDIEIVSTGTAALQIAFTALKTMSPARDTVIVPGYTCPLVVLAASAAGLKVIACDTAPGSFDFDHAHLARLADAATLAVVPTHLGGVLLDAAAARSTARASSPGIAIVEDAAQALGARWGGRSAGLAGDIGVFSLGASKGLTLYRGGALVTRDAATMAQVRATAQRLAKPSMLGELGMCLMLAGYHAAYNPPSLRLVYGWPKRRALARGDDIEAAGDDFTAAETIGRVGAWRKRVGLAALKRLPQHLVTTRARFDALAARLSLIPGLIVHTPAPAAEPSATALFVTLPAHPERELLIRTLWRSRLGVARMFSRAILDYPGITPLMLPGELPNARALAAGTISLSTSPLSSPAAEDIIIATLEGFARHAGWKRG
jgi:perosamine synthetase